MIKNSLKIIAILLISAIVISYTFSVRDSKFELENRLAKADSVHVIDSVNYGKLSFQYDNLNKYNKNIILEKDREIAALAKLKGRVIIKIDTVWAKKDSIKSDFYRFQKHAENYELYGRVKFMGDGWYALVLVDSMVVPIKLDIAFVRHTDNDLVEVRVNTNNKYVVLDSLTSYIKVPGKISLASNKKFGLFAGGLIGNSWGIFGGVRYTNYIVMGTIMNHGYSIGVGYEF